MKSRILPMLLVLMMALAVVTADAMAASISGTSIANANEWETLRLVNKARMANGLSPLTMTEGAQRAASIRKSEVASKFSHSRPNGTNYSTALTEAGITYKTAGENIAYGQRTPAAVMEGWLNSTGHRSNILGSSYTHLGTGYGTGGIYSPAWVQEFFAGACSVSAIYVENADNLSFSTGTSIDDMNLTIRTECSAHGSAYMPLIAEMCTGYNSAVSGTQSVTVAYNNQRVTFKVQLTSNGSSAPTPAPSTSPVPAPSPATQISIADFIKSLSSNCTTGNCTTGNLSDQLIGSLGNGNCPMTDLLSSLLGGSSSGNCGLFGGSNSGNCGITNNQLPLFNNNSSGLFSILTNGLGYSK